ncbi:putative Ig domain-containing protein [Candidatus Spongiihabitans sp.]|uniref:putative Ig domain-containing protein n=1 Tax=Candidatus Spongiihabitans sp. TaxID=3101308 RepID=UPI003C6EC6E1
MPLTYTLTGPSGGALPDGLSFDPATPILSGMPTTEGTSTLTYTVTDANGASVDAAFTVTVSDGPTLNAPADQAYTAGTAITDLELPAAAGGTMPLTYTLTGPLGGALPDGLSFNQDTRILSGAPTTEGTSTLTYTVTDANGASVDAAFTVTVAAVPALTELAGQTYTAGAAITDLELPAAAGGTMPLTYTLTGPSGGALPDGLSFNQDTRILSGAPTTEGTSTLTYTVTDANAASVDAAFTVTVSNGLTLNAPAGQAYTAGTAITDLELPVAAGGTMPLTYTLTGPLGGALPDGLSFNQDTRILSGAPTTEGTSTLTYTVTDANAAVATRTFTVTVSDGPTLNAPADQAYTAGTAITDLELPAAAGGTAPLTYTLTGPSGGALPDGLRFDQDTRILSGAPTAEGTSTLTYTVTDANGASADAAFTVTVSDGPTLNAPAGQAYTAGTAITDLELPAAAGGTAPLTYTLTGPSGGALPDGLSFDQDTRILSGAPTAATAAAVTLTYTVTDANGASVDAAFTVTVSDGPTLNAPAGQTYTVGTAITDLELPAAAGGTAPLTYTLTGPSGGALPDGLSFDQDTRILSGAPTAEGTSTLTYTVTDANGASADAAFTVTVSDGPTLNAPAGQAYTAGTAITDLELPAAAGGTMPLTYTLTGPSGGALPDGLSFDQDSRILSGAPTAEGTSTLTYTVTDANGASSDAAFTVTVSDGPTLNAPAGQAYTAGTAITDLELPAAAGGTAPLTYTLTGPSGGALPDGLSFDQDTRILSGAPTAEGTSTLTYTVTDANGASADAAFTVAVARAAAADASLSALTLSAGALTPAFASDAISYTASVGNAVTSITVTPTLNDANASVTVNGAAVASGETSEAISLAVGGTEIKVVVTAADATTVRTYTVAVARVATADAGEAQTVAEGATVTLDGSASSDPEDKALAYAWTQTGGLTVALSSATVIKPTFTAPTQLAKAATLVFSLIVTNELGHASAAATVTITVAAGANDAPTANAGPDQPAVAEGDLVTLDGSASSDPEGKTLAYAWTQTGGPTVALSSATVIKPTFTAPTQLANNTMLVFSLIVTNELGHASAAATVTIAVTAGANDAPTANAGPMQTVAEGAAVTLDGSASSDPEGETLAYAWTQTDGAPQVTLDTADPSRPTFTAPTQLANNATLVFSLTVTDARDLASGADTVTIAVTAGANDAADRRRNAALNDIILPQVARAMAGSVVSAIERRIGQSGSAARALAVGGQRTLAGALSTHGKAMAEDRRDLKEMLAGSDFVLPLNAGDGAAGRSSAVFWGLGEYRKLSGDSVALDWDGDLSGVHLGVDARLGDDLLVGVAASRMQGDFNYKDDNAGDLLDLGKGEYGLNMTSAHPYIGWGAGQLDLWATVGYGEGKLEKTEKGKAMLSSDVDLRTVGAGGSGQLWEVGASGYRLKGEAMRSELEVKGAAGAAKVDAVRLRAALEGSQSRTLSAGGLFESSLEVGVRYDGGDGETGSGAEIGGRLSYRNPVTRATVEVRARALLGHSGGYEEWGIQGKLAVQPGADGQGLSLSLVPSYGESGSGIQELWRDGLLEDGDDNAAADYRARVEARLGYGFALRERDGVLTPYGEMTLGATDSYRIGLNWKAGSRFDLNLAGERSESNSGPTEHAILIKSEVRF